MIESIIHCWGLIQYHGYSLQSVRPKTKKLKGMFSAWHQKTNTTFVHHDPLEALLECERQVKAKTEKV